MLYFRTEDGVIWLRFEVPPRNLAEISLNGGKDFEKLEFAGAPQSNEIVYTHNSQRYCIHTTPSEGSKKKSGDTYLLNGNPLIYVPGGFGRADR